MMSDLGNHGVVDKLIMAHFDKLSFWSLGKLYIRLIFEAKLIDDPIVK